ncbi:uncharacterized protein LOC132818538 [Hemiscyllium ocellatum]|uniref:uncharacterized protein LOC132818538 n=1 Tax=Hemiscyllium ocellatum TaxID=170820 RepID=UPI0029667CA9|nr:uncharacterized protein LOC132818538 [Hemiscyllium ocellatum]
MADDDEGNKRTITSRIETFLDPVRRDYYGGQHIITESKSECPEQRRATGNIAKRKSPQCIHIRQKKIRNWGKGTMRANRQQTNGKTTNHRWDSKLFSYSRWELNDSVNDDGYYLLQPCQPHTHFKCKDLDVEAIIISSQLSNSTHGSSKEIESCMNEEYFAGRKGKHSPLQQITSKDLNEYATNSQNTTEPISRKCTTIPLVRKHTNGQQKSDIPNATWSVNKCANLLVPIPNHVHGGNELKGQVQVMQSRSTISECDDQENSSYCKNSSQACELSTAKELLLISKMKKRDIGKKSHFKSKLYPKNLFTQEC